MIKKPDFGLVVDRTLGKLAPGSRPEVTGKVSACSLDSPCELVVIQGSLTPLALATVEC